MPLSRIMQIAGVAALSASMLAGRKPKPADPRVETQLVRVTEVRTASAADRAFTGTVAARVQSDLRFRVAGKIVERLVDAGQTVKSEQPLMRIDRTDLKHAITIQAGNLAAARAHAVQTLAEEARARSLVGTGAVSRSTFDQAKAASDSARALLSAAEAQAQVAENEGDYSVLLADGDGTVMETLAEPGQVVAAGQVVLRLAHAGPREAAVSLPETLRPAIGSSADATLFRSDSLHATARLRQLSDTADPRTRTYDARYVLEGSLARAPLGATVTIRVSSERSPNEMEVPLGALGDEGQGPGVWLLDPATMNVSFRRVMVGTIGEESAILESGVQAGQTIVALGGQLLHEGERVRIAQDRQAAR